mmetsp:Transcript_43402/g.85632  ORF Transcript_43402/g.85632 Transcript_43402/m.85632 type:complete len:128 (-) Transcript_43402:3347-3730(-)
MNTTGLGDQSDIARSSRIHRKKKKTDCTPPRCNMERREGRKIIGRQKELRGKERRKIKECSCIHLMHPCANNISSMLGARPIDACARIIRSDTRPPACLSIRMQVLSLSLRLPLFIRLSQQQQHQPR